MSRVDLKVTGPASAAGHKDLGSCVADMFTSDGGVFG